MINFLKMLSKQKGEGCLLHILMGRARTGKSGRVLQRIAALGDSSQQILLVPLIYILPCFFADKAFAVFLAEPVADFGAVVMTSVMFYRQFRRSMRALEETTGET